MGSRAGEQHVSPCRGPSTENVAAFHEKRESMATTFGAAISRRTLGGPDPAARMRDERAVGEF